jgi:hypothetical protein
MAKENRKNLQYGSGISGPFAADSRTKTPTKTTPTENSRAGKNGKTEYQCQYCGLWGQRQTSSKACLKNKNKKSVESVESCVGEKQGGIGKGVYALGVSFYLGCDCRMTKTTWY